jgi:hypothetical protein
MSFHIAPCFPESSSGTIPNCEYLVHKPDAVIHTLFSLPLTVQRHFCSILKQQGLDGLIGKRAILAFHPALTSARSLS